MALVNKEMNILVLYNGWEFLESLSNWRLLKDSASWSFWVMTPCDLTGGYQSFG
jgi:hypothetical protein